MSRLFFENKLSKKYIKSYRVRKQEKTRENKRKHIDNHRNTVVNLVAPI